ncbi:MAG: xylulokinase [Lachnospiraceae bacterium]|jgi:sugar (pentulose or hexulose) kinase
MNGRETISAGKAVLGIEFGSTRIKAVLNDEEGKPIAQGSHEWENRLENGVWTYSLDDIWTGLQDCYADLQKDVRGRYGEEIRKLAAIGFSAMMHGYMVFDKEGSLMVPFRTWRNTMTGEAAAKLTELFRFNIPQRWSIAHLYQAILNGEDHVSRIDYMTTLAGYIHWKMTGRRVVGVGEASGMFPIDSSTGYYNREMLNKFDELTASHHYPWKVEEILPGVLTAGENAGTLTEEGARLLDVSGTLEPGCPLCPPEGDAGTGMAATNSVAQRTGNVSAGTSVFAMVVLEKPLKKVHPELDIVTTPDGADVAMVHCNNCTSDLNAWVGLFRELLEMYGVPADMNTLYGRLYTNALSGEKDGGGLLAYNYFSGEPVTGFEEGRPLFVRKPDAKLNLANFMRVHLYSSLAALKSGLDILLKEENVRVDRVTGHGGLFKTKGVGQSILAAAMDTPVTVMETAGEGGAWGIALLAGYMISRKEGQSLADYLNTRIFAGNSGTTVAPDPEDVKGFDDFMKVYKAGLPIEHAAVDAMPLD